VPIQGQEALGKIRVTYPRAWVIKAVLNPSKAKGEFPFFMDLVKKIAPNE
jgi:hypothetical protein